MRATLIRILWLLFLVFAALASLLTFPGGVPYMVLAWCGLFTWLARRPRLAWFPLGQLAVILAMKRPPVDWGTRTLSGCLLVAFGLALASLWPRRAMSRSATAAAARKRLAVAVAIMWLGGFAVLIQWRETEHTSRRPELDPRRPVAIIGDSLSSGTQPEYAYARYLRERIAPPVADFSQQGITSRQALAEFDDVLAVNPQCVVIEIGGHDYLKDIPRSEAVANIREMIERARAIDAEVILFEISRDFMLDPYCWPERELADKFDLELIPDTPIRRMVLWSEMAPPGMWLDRESHLSDDGLHPNRQGAEMMADYVAEALSRVYGPAILERD